jgi:hypothetical protein
VNALEIRNRINALKLVLDYAMLKVISGIDEVKRIEAEIGRLEMLLKPVNANAN